MNKIDFITELEGRLSGLPEKDIRASLDYYYEIIDDKIEDGMSEEAAIAAIGTPDEIAKTILSDMPLSKIILSRIKGRGFDAKAIMAIILGSPLWIAFAAIFASVLISVYAALWSVVVSLWAADLGFAAGILVGIGFGAHALFSGAGGASALMFFGSALASAALAILFFFVCIYTSRGMVFVSKKLFKFIKLMFVKKEALK